MGVDFKAKQAEFAAYIRDPVSNPAPGDINPARMAMYRELFFNNIDSFLSSNFPVLRTILTDQQWQALAQDFFAHHACTTPHFSEIAEEFIDYLQNERHNSDDYPFLLELAHYEWVEMALSISKASFCQGDDVFIADLRERKIALSPLAWPLVYRYPVERIAPSYLPSAAPEQPTYLIVYRDQYDIVRFMQTNAPTFRLLQLLQQQPGSATSCLQALVAETGHPDPDTLLQYGLQTLQQLAAKGIVIPVDGA